MSLIAIYLSPKEFKKRKNYLDRYNLFIHIYKIYKFMKGARQSAVTIKPEVFLHDTITIHVHVTIHLCMNHHRKVVQYDLGSIVLRDQILQPMDGDHHHILPNQ